MTKINGTVWRVKIERTLMFTKKKRKIKRKIKKKGEKRREGKVR